MSADGLDAACLASVCRECSDSRAVPDDFAEDGYAPCPACVIDAGATFVVFENVGSA
jgi:hypothetical protein